MKVSREISCFSQLDAETALFRCCVLGKGASPSCLFTSLRLVINEYMRDKDGEMVAELEQFMNSSRDKGVNVQVVSRGVQPIMFILLIANVVVHHVRSVCSVLSWNIPKNT